LALLLASCAETGDFGRQKPGFWQDTVVPAMGRSAAYARDEPVAWGLLTDDEQELRRRAWHFVMPPQARNGLERQAAAAALARIAGLDWTRYPYTVILVLGDGPDRPDQRIGTYGKLRLARAARLYHEGLAPLLIVSGGNVHPALTPINEAIEIARNLATAESARFANGVLDRVRKEIGRDSHAAS
jgi:hypothetical protein